MVTFVSKSSEYESIYRNDNALGLVKSIGLPSHHEHHHHPSYSSASDKKNWREKEREIERERPIV